jgi:diguanylate cyclase (GGDEF)-like protein
MSERRFSREGLLGLFPDFLASPGRAGGVFALAAVFSVLLVLPSKHLTTATLALMIFALVIAVAQTVVHLTIGHRLPRWSLHLDIIIDISLITAVCALVPGVVVEFAFLYLWVILYGALYLSLRAFFIYYGYVALAYGYVVLQAKTPEHDVLMWAPLLGTGLVIGIVTASLVSLLRQSSDVDPLTKLPNRRAWDRRADEEFERAKRNSTVLSLIMIDVDNFKLVNDRDGHQAGDDLLRMLADGWRERVRVGVDFIARLGGDEFGFLASGTDSIEIARVVERLQELIPEGVSCSFGTSSWDGVGTLADLVRGADEAMYQMKRQRKLDRGANPAPGE